jgi:hypothetical protein
LAGKPALRGPPVDTVSVRTKILGHPPELINDLSSDQIDDLIACWAALRP